MRKLAIVTTHPVQYNAPLFELLTGRNKISIRVFYTWGESVLEKKYDPGFGKVVEWDIPLLKGYPYQFTENVAKEKGSHHFKGIDNPSIIEAIREFSPDAIMVYGWAFKSHLKVLRYFKNKIPVLFRGDSTLLDERGFLSSLKRRLLLTWVYRHIDIALYAGKNNYNYFRYAGLKKEQLVFAPHAVDNARFECNEQQCKIDAADFRTTLNIPAGAFVFLFAGKLEPKKDPEILLKAFVAAYLDKDVHLLLVGNGVLESGLKNKYSKQTNIHFFDFVNQSMMPAVYEASDVFVLPSKGPGETWGLAVNEAMANGKAVIVSNKCGCVVDLVEEGVNGFIFTNGSEASLADKLKLIYGNNHLSTMQRYSKNKIKKYSLDTLAGVIEQTVLNGTKEL